MLCLVEETEECITYTNKVLKFDGVKFSLIFADVNWWCIIAQKQVLHCNIPRKGFSATECSCCFSRETGSDETDSRC
jgi:hypothetical protein